MSGEDQERFEDYLELEQYIADLQAGRVAHPPENLTPSQARIYRMAALFRSGSPDAATPRAEFVEELRARLLAMDPFAEEEDTQKRPVIGQMPEQVLPPAQPKPEVPAAPIRPEVTSMSPPERRGRPSRVSRRSLFSRGAVAAAAASLTLGAGAGAAAMHMAQSSAESSETLATPTPPYPNGKVWLLPTNTPGMTWHYVTTLDQLGDEAIKFVTDGVVGFLIKNDGDDKTETDQIIAMSAACTHMGCIVKWDGASQHFRCPCHGGMFTEYGKPMKASPVRYLAPLPRLRVQVDQPTGKIYVEVPKSTT